MQGVLKDESGEQFLWALAAVKRMCQDRMPESIFTDADPAAELALNTLFPSMPTIAKKGRFAASVLHVLS